MQSHSLSRELALLMLGQVDDRGSKPMPPSDLSMEALLHQVQASLALHVREALDHSAGDLEQAQQQLLDSELQQEILGSPGCSASYRDFFADMAQKKTWVDMGTSAALCVRLVTRPGAFASGAHVDFYDAQKAEQAGAE